MPYRTGSSNIFGTDGIRGRANEYPLNVEFAVLLGKALVETLFKKKKNQERELTVLIGKDTRISGSLFEYAIAAAISSMGVHVKTLGVLPTPALAYLTRYFNADAGIMISASHNPYFDNGIKIFNEVGYKLSEDDEKEISNLILSGKAQDLQPNTTSIGTISHDPHAHTLYSTFITELFPESFRLDKLRLIVDCAHGANYSIAPLIFKKLGGTVIAYAASPNGTNINHHCGAVYPDRAARLTVERDADVGISLDGDGDRCLLIDETGTCLDGDQILGICALDMANRGLLAKNKVVATPMSNIGLELSLAPYGISVVKAPVGDRHVLERMHSEGSVLGGEQSGHTIFRAHATTGDGILTALKVLEIMKRKAVPLSQLKKSITLYPQVKLNIPVKRKEPFSNYNEIMCAISNAEEALKDKGRVFVRYSGTEPVARIMLEGEDLQHIRVLSRDIATSMQMHLG